MKLKDSFITSNIEGKQFIVCLDKTFSGVIRSNETAAFIVNCLKEDISAEGIAEKMSLEYNADPEVMIGDINRIIESLRSIGAIEE